MSENLGKKPMGKRKTAWDMMPAADRAAIEAHMRRKGQVPLPALSVPSAPAAALVEPKRNKYGARKHEEDGFTFDSGLELDRYRWLKAQAYVTHIDVHPIVTIDAGKHGRVSLDFGVWIDPDRFPLDEVSWEARGQEIETYANGYHYEDVKSWAYFDPCPSKRIRKTEFMRTWQRFDNAHPAAPLWVITRQSAKSAWIVKRRGRADIIEPLIPGGNGEWR